MYRAHGTGTREERDSEGGSKERVESISQNIKSVFDRKRFCMTSQSNSTLANQNHRGMGFSSEVPRRGLWDDGRQGHESVVRRVEGPEGLRCGVGPDDRTFW